MGEEEDAELIDTRNVELEDVGGDDQYPTVFHATRTPDSGSHTALSHRSDATNLAY